MGWGVRVGVEWVVAVCPLSLSLSLCLLLYSILRDFSSLPACWLEAVSLSLSPPFARARSLSLSLSLSHTQACRAQRHRQ